MRNSARKSIDKFYQSWVLRPVNNKDIDTSFNNGTMIIEIVERFPYKFCALQLNLELNFTTCVLRKWLKNNEVCIWITCCLKPYI